MYAINSSYTCKLILRVLFVCMILPGNGRSATSSQLDENITPAEEKKIRMEARKQERIQAIRADEEIKMLEEASAKRSIKIIIEDIKAWNDCLRAGTSCTETSDGKLLKHLADNSRKGAWDVCLRAGASCTETSDGKILKHLDDSSRKEYIKDHQPPTR